MTPPPSNPQLNDYELKKQHKLQEQESLQIKRTLRKIVKTISLSALVAGPIAGLIWYAATLPPTLETDIVSKKGLHWHPTLSMEIKGQKQEIPANLGLGGGVMSTMHTHDTSGTIHLEKQGIVTKDDVKLSRFFKIWNKRFDSNCILDSCNGPDGSVKMFVNGTENTEFENYQMKDKDKIEIRFE